MAKVTHVHIDIEEALRWSDGMLTDFFCLDEEPMTPDEVRDFLRDEYRKGYTYFSSCDNRRKDGRCAGHEKDEDGEIR